MSSGVARAPGTPDDASLRARRARAAVAVLFFANGAAFANAVPRYPDLKAGLGLTNTLFGSAVAAYGLGALVVGLGAGVLVGRFGSARVAPASTVVMAANLVLIGAAPTWWALAAVLCLAGAVDAIGDVAANAHALRVERLLRRSILNSQHAVWSIGAVVGGVMGAVAADLRVPPVWHLAVVAVLLAALALGTARFLLPGPDGPGDGPEDGPRDGPGTAVPDGGSGARPARERARGRARGRVRVAGTLAALGGVAALAQAMEDVGATWSPLYLREDLAAAPALAASGFIALQALQTVGRLLGDRAVTRYGDRAVARAGAAMAGTAMAGALAVPTQAGTVVAFGAVGLGIGTLIPAALRAADGLPGLPRGAGLTVVGGIDRLAILAGPAVIGLLADAAGLRAALVAVPAAAAVVVLLTPVLPGRSPGEQRLQGPRGRNRR